MDPKYKASSTYTPQCTSTKNLTCSLFDGIWGSLKAIWGVLVCDHGMTSICYLMSVLRRALPGRAIRLCTSTKGLYVSM